MNENPEGMPNPLNPNPGPDLGGDTLDANPSEPMPSMPARGMGMIEDIQRPAAPNPTPMGPASAGPAPMESLPTDPMARPMEKAPVPEIVTPPKKKKTGLIIGIIVGLVVLIGGVAAAVVVMNMNKGDAVAKAMAKVVKGEMPTNMAVDGKIEVAIDSESSALSNVSVELKSDAVTNSLINSSAAKITATLEGVGDVAFEFDEIYVGDGNLYLKVDGMKTLLEGSSQTTDLEAEQTDNVIPFGAEYETYDAETGATTAYVCEDENGCVVAESTTAEGGETASAMSTMMLSALSGIIENIDGQWLKIPVDELTKTLAGNSMDSTELSCVANFINDAKSSNNSIADAYSKNPFVSSTTEGVTLPSVSGNPVYKVVVDGNKFASFTQAMQDSSLVKDLYSCMSHNDNVTVDTDEIVSSIAALPDLYVEVDKDYNFTRLYFTNTSESDGVVDGGNCTCPEGVECIIDCVQQEKTTTTTTVDLGFSYPANVNIAEPVEYKNFSEVIQELMSSMYSLEYTEVDVIEEEPTAE